MINAGGAIRVAKFSAIEYHLHHKVSDLSMVGTNEILLKETEEKKLTYVKNGMIKGN